MAECGVEAYIPRMTKNGTDIPDVPPYDPATVAWNLFCNTVTAEALRQRMAEAAYEIPNAEDSVLRSVSVAKEAFLSGYHAGRADGEAWKE